MHYGMKKVPKPFDSCWMNEYTKLKQRFSLYNGTTKTFDSFTKEKLSALTPEDLNSVLKYSVKNYNDTIVKYFYHLGIKVGSMNKLTTTAIHAAALVPVFESVDQLFNIYGDNNYVSPGNYSHFHAACITGNLSMVQKFLDQGVDINQPCQLSYGKYTTALHLAVTNQHLNVVKLLLKRGADPNIFDDARLTPFDHFSQLQHYNIKNEDLCKKILGLFIKRKCKFNTCNEKGNSPMLNLFSRGIPFNRVQKFALKLFLCNKANPRHINKSGQTILHLLLNSKTSAAVKSYPDGIEMIELLLECGVNVNVKDRFGDTPLNVAVSHCNKYAVEVLLDYGADMNDINFQGGFLSPSNKILRDLKMTRYMLDIVELLKSRGFRMTSSHNASLLQFLVGFEEAPARSLIYCPLVIESGSARTIRNYCNYIAQINELPDLRYNVRKIAIAHIVTVLQTYHFTKMYMSEEMRSYLEQMEEDLRKKDKGSYTTSEYSIETIKREIGLTDKIMINDHTTLFDFCLSNHKEAHELLKRSAFMSIVDSEEFEQKCPTIAGIIRGYALNILVKEYCNQNIQLDPGRLLIEGKLPNSVADTIIHYVN
ncbi:hypothetical protein TKK_0013393 [Trichogramma kaykai]